VFVSLGGRFLSTQHFLLKERDEEPSFKKSFFFLKKKREGGREREQDV